VSGASVSDVTDELQRRSHEYKRLPLATAKLAVANRIRLCETEAHYCGVAGDQRNGWRPKYRRESETMRSFLKILGGLILVVMALLLYGMLTMKPEDKIAYDAERAVKQDLRDPSSAEFRKVYTYKKTDGSLTVCGEVNSRNGFGAMSGFSRFVYLSSGVAIIESPGPDAGGTFDDVWQSGNCIYGRDGAIAVID
jgi:hypothetical protein